ncbi:uncharacterized protein FOMMEDRAFT_155101 [Fomitiporia mediterranea MF3/22]|uniref:uncharacterized protein n=1 Tax=Fomitiporia mediterranea (strain MF3/22) TaxID=694068 RepID=UPI00044083A2|nr:uncharacterized protein FOMMEDRAFT_155101 [Fomitiporia mediterranea MF3/22]EJD03979.1 hypothetical protein FOMMEDRAFT_155101 [Fomitiporia mediterranea MF3/22]
MSSMQTSKNTGNVAGGYKAALKNPNVSEEAKERSQQALEEMGDSGELQQPDMEAGKNTGNVIGGHKATLANPRVSEEAKEHSRAVLEDNQAL